MRAAGMSSGAALVSWRWCSACGALVRDWKWTDFCKRPEMRSISSCMAAVVMRQWSLLLFMMSYLSHAGMQKAMLLGTHYCTGSGLRLLYCYVAQEMPEFLNYVRLNRPYSGCIPDWVRACGFCTVTWNGDGRLAACEYWA